MRKISTVTTFPHASRDSEQSGISAASLNLVRAALESSGKGPAPYSKTRLQRALKRLERRKVTHEEAVASAMARTG